MDWLEKTHTFENSTLLQESDIKLNPSNFKGSLFVPQKTLLHVLISLENKRTVNIDGLTIYSHKARISEKPSFGKTVVILALICTQKIPQNITQNIMTIQYNKHTNGFIPEMKIEYSKLINQTFVLANSTIISQWESETLRFTNLRFFTIENVHTLKEFEKIYLTNKIDNYDIIFIKAGKVTSNFISKGESKKTQTKNRSIIEAINSILDGVIVARVIIDDYDTLKIGSDDCFIPSMFTWLISATNRVTNAKVHVKYNQDTIEEFFKNNMNIPILTAAHDDVINYPLSIRCHPEYVDKYINSTKVDFRVINVKGGRAASILKDLEISDEVIEMINANAINTAAQTLGIDANDVGSVVKKLVGEKLESLKNSIKILDRIKKAQNTQNVQLQPEDIKLIREIVKNGTDEEFDNLKSEEEIKVVLSMEESAKAYYDKISISLNRMRDNIREGCCQCCKIEFEEEPAFILVGCCQIVLCETCIIRDINGTKLFINRCPNCAVDVKANSDIMRVGKEIELNLVLENETIMNVSEQSEIKNIVNGELDYKLRALIQFIDNKELECISNTITEPFIDGLLDGNLNNPWTQQKKFLIFTMHSESTAYLHKKLTQHKISHCILKGTRSQKDEAINLLKNSVNVLIVTAAKDCGGINMPFLSHIIFYHQVIDHNIELQVAGRGQRQGRLQNLEIVKLLNESELHI